jgi:hypothetical protein
MCVMLTPVIVFIISPARCAPPPTPDEPYVSPFGVVFASAMRSLMVFTGTLGCVASTKGKVTSCVTGARSVIESKGIRA